MTIPEFDWKAEVRRRIRSVPVTGEQEAGIVEEIAQDLEARHAALLQQGIDDLAARQQVLDDLDVGHGLDHNLSRIERQWSAASATSGGNGSIGESILQDCRFAVRAFGRRPLFTAVAVLAIAIGVAGMTTVFSLVNTVLIRALPLSRFEHVVMVWQQDLTTGRDRMTLSPLEFQEYGRATSFDAVAAIRGTRLNVGTGSTPLAVGGIQVSPELFETLGVTPILGRGFSRSDDAADEEVVITSEFGAGLVFVSSRALEATFVGYDPASSLTLRVSLPPDGYARPEQRAAFFETLLDRFAALPGVSHAGAVSILPQMDTNRTLEFDLDSAAPGAAPDRPSARFRVTTPGYFESLGIRVVRGRTFQRSDLAAGAVVVSQSLAERFWPGVNPIDRQMRLALPPPEPSPWLTVVGVVEDVRQWINTPPDPTLYWANLQQTEFAFALRTTVDPSTLITAATRVVRDLDPQQAVFDVQTMRERLDGSQQLTYGRFRTAIMSGFGLTALLLAGLGIYGVVRYSVVQRTQEFGIRMALGASPGQVFGVVLRQSLRSTAVGCVIGLLGSIAIGRFLGSVLYGGVSAQPIIIGTVAVLLGGLSAAAAMGPARRASRVDPLIALRSE